MSDTLVGTIECGLCDGTCVLGNVAAWIAPELAWFWGRLARVGGNRTDISLCDGTFWVTAPADVTGTERAELLLGVSLEPRRSHKVDLARVAKIVAPLSPGAIAAHAVAGQLAGAKQAKAWKIRRKAILKARCIELFALTPSQWEELNNSGWSTNPELSDPGVLESVKAVIEALPGEGVSIDRRRLAFNVLGNPHGLDRRRVVAKFALALLKIQGKVTSAQADREAWRQVGVVGDSIHEGIAMVNISPVGMTLAAGMVVVVPPRTLAEAQWEAGAGDVFVTENPSILEAAMEIEGARIICTMGTPSKEALGALARLSAAGWRLRVQADFDAAGLKHVAGVLAQVPGAVAWRMGLVDYLQGLATDGSKSVLRHSWPLVSPWDPELARAMDATGLMVNEEALLDQLLSDVATSVAAES